MAGLVAVDLPKTGWATYFQPLKDIWLVMDWELCTFTTFQSVILTHKMGKNTSLDGRQAIRQTLRLRQTMRASRAVSRPSEGHESQGSHEAHEVSHVMSHASDQTTQTTAGSEAG